MAFVPGLCPLAPFALFSASMTRCSRLTSLSRHHPLADTRWCLVSSRVPPLPSSRSTPVAVLAGLCTLTTGLAFLLLLRRSHARWKHQDDGQSHPHSVAMGSPANSFSSQISLSLQLYRGHHNPAQYAYERRV